MGLMVKVLPLTLTCVPSVIAIVLLSVGLAGLISRMERDGHLSSAPDGRDRRSRRITMTASGHDVWNNQAMAKIHGYYDRVLADFSTSDMTHTLHYLLKLLDNMKQLDGVEPAGDEVLQ